MTVPPVVAAHPFEDLTAWEWALVGLAVLGAAWVVWKAVMLTLRPGETEPGHIKRSILEDGERGRGRGPAE